MLTVVSLLSSCSPLYVFEAGVEEARILWRRRPIEKLIEDPATDPALREKLKLVLAARAYAESIGLHAEGSFTQYSHIDRDVLLWVLSGSSKVALSPVTWWFPIVGNIPYKGFFDKEDADREAETLAKKDFDIFLRPSSAFSTLGWFDDPLLSTTARHEDISLVNTVIHEILHNTIWIPDHAPFNETFANFVGSVGSEEFYRAREGATSAGAATAHERWVTDIDFARFLEETVKELEPLYASVASAPPAPGDPQFAQLVVKRDAIFQSASERWRMKHGDTSRRKSALNNATIIAYQIYLTRPWLFQELYEVSGSSLPAFVKEMKVVEERVKKTKKDPYDVLGEYISERKNQSTLSVN